MAMPLPIPGRIAIPATLREGTVLYFAETAFSSVEPHYFVVLNHRPLTDPIVIMVNATSNVAKRKGVRTGFPPETLVEVSPPQCTFLDRVSIFDCNSPTPHKIEVLIKKYDDGDLKLIHDPAPQPLVDELRRGVIASPLVEGQLKAMLR